MATHRDEVRAARSEVNRRAQKLGIDLAAERARLGANARTLTVQAIKLTNDATPRVTKDQLRVDDPPSGAFNGVNTVFTLSVPVAGNNIAVVYHDSTNNVCTPLTRSSAAPPAAGEFTFNPSFPTTIEVATPPQPADRLVAVYRTEL